jgi:hypothetical protein
MGEITFEALFKRTSTTVDGGWSLTLTVNQSEAQALMDLMKFRDNRLQVAIIPINENSIESIE